MAGIASACFIPIGPSAEKYRPAARPEGVQMRGTVAAAPFEAELLAVEADSLLVLKRAAPPVGSADCVVLRVPFAAINELVPAQTGLGVRDGRSPNTETRERLRLISRFPKGVPAEALPKLLDVCGQSEIGVVRHTVRR
jgi:hypothetical protein